MSVSIIYGARCLINSKWYIGKTDRSLEERIKEHKRSASTNAPDLFHKTMRDMGLRNFEWKELERCPKEEVYKREKKWIKDLGAESIEILNTTHARKISKPSGSVIRSNVQSAIAGKQAWQNPSAKKWMQLSGKLMPVINLETGQKYQSLSDASKKGPDRRPGIKKSCETGRPALTGNRYAYLDIDGNPILKKGHKAKFSRTKRVKNLITGKIYNSIAEAANIHGSSASQVQAVCKGKYKTAKGIPFCYIDDNGKDILTGKHHKYCEEKEQKKNLAYAAWRIGDVNKEKMVIYDTTEELSKVLGVNQAHIPAVCRGKRQHDHGWRIAFFDKNTKKLNLKESHLTKIKKQLRKIICLDDNKTFNNLAAAAKYYGLIQGQIGSCCEGVLKSTGQKDLRRRFAYLDDKGKPIITQKHKEPFEWIGHIQLFCPQTGEKYQSVAHCSRDTGIPQKRIRRYLKDNSVNLGGFTLIPVKKRK